MEFCCWLKLATLSLDQFSFEWFHTNVIIPTVLELSSENVFLGLFLSSNENSKYFLPNSKPWICCKMCSRKFGSLRTGIGSRNTKISHVNKNLVTPAVNHFSACFNFLLIFSGFHPQFLWWRSQNVDRVASSLVLSNLVMNQGLWMIRQLNTSSV